MHILYSNLFMFLAGVARHICDLSEEGKLNDKSIFPRWQFWTKGWMPPVIQTFHVEAREIRSADWWRDGWLHNYTKLTYTDRTGTEHVAQVKPWKWRWIPDRWLQYVPWRDGWHQAKFMDVTCVALSAMSAARSCWWIHSKVNVWLHEIGAVDPAGEYLPFFVSMILLAIEFATWRMVYSAPETIGRRLKWWIRKPYRNA